MYSFANRCFPALLVAAFVFGGGVAQNPTPPAPPTPAKGPDKAVAEKLATLKEIVADRKFARDAEGVQVVDFLLQKLQGGTLEAKDKAAVVKGFAEVFTGRKVRPPDSTGLYYAAAMAPGYCGADGSKVLKSAYDDGRFPKKPLWVPLREQLLKNLGRTKDESQVKFLTSEARRHPEAALQAAAGEALGNFEDSKEPIRKEIVSELLVTYGELDQAANQGGMNINSQNATDRLATIKDKWNTTLEKLTGQRFDRFIDWQSWHNKHKNQPW